MPDDEYELLPSAEIARLRDEVEKIKRNPLGDTQASVSLLASINALNENITKLVNIFQSANEELLRAYNDQSIQEELRKVREENAKIAHGIVALAELVRDVQSAHPQMVDSLPMSAPVMPPPQAGAMQPPLGMPEPQPAMGTPPDLAFQEDALTQDLKGRSNPFADPLPQYQPILDKPLPRPGQAVQKQEISFDEIPPPPPR